MQILPTLWAMAAGACCILAVPNITVWLTRRETPANLLFALTALGAAGVAMSELAMMQAESGEVFARAMKLGQAPVALLVISLTWFVASYLGSRHTWAAWVITAGWLLVVVINAASPYGIVFGELPRLSPIELSWGESVATVDAAPGPWKFLPDLLTPLFLLFVSDATWSAWKRGMRRRAGLIGGSSLFFMGLAGIHSPLVDTGVLNSPYIISLTFLGVVLAMGLELTFDAAKTAELSMEVKSNEKRFRTLLENVQLLVLGVDEGRNVTYVNPFFSVLTGYSSDELLGEPLSTIVPGDSPGAPTHEETLATKAGEERKVVWSSVELKGPADERAGLLSIGSDVTEQRRAEGARDTALRESERALREVQALQKRLEAQVVYLQEEIKTTGGFDEIVGDSDPLVYVLHKVEEVAPLDTTVLIEGETGVGKELIARAIHARSARRKRALVTINCASLPPTLIESELFGHEKGAFTGASRLRRGRFEVADGATLFLDEIGELPLDLQGKLLRVLQEGEIERVGGDHTLKVDVRILAATNRDLKKEIEAGTFREDLYYRLHVYPLTVPPLRKRRKDIPELVNAFVQRFTKAQRKRIDEIPQSVMDELTRYDWPGNVRELENVIQRAVINCKDGTLRLAEPLSHGSSTSTSRPADGYRGTLDDIDREYVRRVLELAAWRIEGTGGAAELLGLHPNTLRFRMRKLGIKRPAAQTS